MQKKVALSPKEFRSFKLLEVQPINYNTKLYRFSTNDAAASIGLTVASCLVTRAVIDGKGKCVLCDQIFYSEIIRPYTPTSTEAVTGHFDLVVKEYPTGVMSKHIASMKPGDSLEMKGPFPKVEQSID
jgi:cytochrome-b5 reductase